ncbi:MAG: isochorismatase family protein [Bacteroidetes bacterium]|nr:isochorismatase family protein [Bacteroidota bacterium]
MQKLKTDYFTSATLRAKSEKMLSELQPYRDRHSFGFIPERSALLVLDMQRYFLDKNSHAYVPSAAAITENILLMTDLFIKRELPVILTRHTDVTEGSGSMMRWWKDSIREDDLRSEVIPELSRQNTIIICKSSYDAFYGTSLDDLLRGKGITQLVITGVLTHLCCETTARSAFVRGYTVFFTIDGTATFHEGFHKASLLNLSHGFAVPVLCKEILKVTAQDL